MDLKTKLLRIIRVNTKQRDSARKAVKAAVYNKVIDGEYKGWLEKRELIPPEGVEMSVWTKEQSADLDQRFGGVNGRLDVLEKDMKEVKSDIKNIKSDIKNILGMMKTINEKLDAR